MRRLATVAMIAMLVAACTLGATDAPRVHVLIDDRPWTLLPAGPDGMRDRDGFAGADGMLFDLGAEVDPGAVMFVMDRVRSPLDIAWFDGQGDLVGIASMAACAAEPCPTTAAPARFRFAIEAPPGAFDGLGADAHLNVGTP